MAMSRASWAFVLSSLVLLAGVVTVAILLLLARPEAPDGAPLEARWAQVQAWAAPLSTGDAVARLQSAVDRLAASPQGLEPVLEIGGPVPAVPAEALPQAARASLDDLVAWHRAGGGLGSETCPPELDALGLLRLVRLAMTRPAAGAAAMPAASRIPPEVEAALRLAEALRHQGALLAVTVGYRGAEEGVAWARREQLPVAVLPHPPTVEAMFPAVAREYVCAYAMAESVFAGRAGEPLPPSLERLEPAELGPFVEIERRNYKAWVADLLTRAAPHRDDPAALARAVGLRPEESGRRGTLVDLLAIDASDQVRAWAEAVAAYRPAAGRRKVSAPPTTREGG